MKHNEDLFNASPQRYKELDKIIMTEEILVKWRVNNKKINYLKLNRLVSD